MNHCDITKDNCDIRDEHCNGTVEACDITLKHCVGTKEHCHVTKEHCDGTLVHYVVTKYHCHAMLSIMMGHWFSVLLQITIVTMVAHDIFVMSESNIMMV